MARNFGRSRSPQARLNSMDANTAYLASKYGTSTYKCSNANSVDELATRITSATGLKTQVNMYTIQVYSPKGDVLLYELYTNSTNAGISVSQVVPKLDANALRSM